MPKITDLTADTAPDGSDVIPFVDVSAGATEKVTVDNLAASTAFGGRYQPLGSASTSGYADPLHRWRQAFYDDPDTAKIVILGDSTSDDAGNAPFLYSVLREFADPGAFLAGMNPANIVSGGNNGSSLLAWLTDAAASNSAQYSWSDLQADAPDLVIASWGINDVRTNATTLAQMIDRIDDMITLIQGTLGDTDILLRMPNALRSGGGGLITGITAQAATDLLREAYLYFVGRYANVDVIDMQAEVFGTTAVSASPLMLDEVHPDVTGYGHIALKLAERIGHPLMLGPVVEGFYGYGIVVQGGSNFFDIGVPFTVELLDLHPEWRPVRWPINASTDSFILSTYGRMALTSATFGTTGGNTLRVFLSGSWASLVGQTISLNHGRRPGVQDGRQIISINPGNVVAGSKLDVTATVSGVTSTENTVIVQPNTSILSTGLVWSSMVSAANTITIRLYNPTGADIDMAAGDWRVWVVN